MFTPHSANVEFGWFKIEPHRCELLADGEPIKLGGRAFDLLMALIEASGGCCQNNGWLESEAAVSEAMALSQKPGR